MKPVHIVVVCIDLNIKVPSSPALIAFIYFSSEAIGEVEA
jgi:hypothetical protein